MMEPVEIITVGKTVAKIYWDDSPSSPREWDNLSEMVAFARLWREYMIADREANGYEEDARERGILTRWYSLCHGAEIKLYRFVDYGSSGARMHSVDTEDDASGFFMVTREKMIEEYGDDSPESREKARSCMDGEFKVMRQYVEGDVYGYMVDGEDGDSCWGFYGMEDVKREAQGAAEYAEHERLINQEPTDVAEILATMGAP